MVSMVDYAYEYIFCLVLRKFGLMRYMHIQEKENLADCSAPPPALNKVPNENLWRNLKKQPTYI